jgi:hypothetical protein
MKIVIREGAFETNSSSEHTIVISTTTDFKKWKEGKLLARIKNKQESEVTWGNFSSRMYTTEFTEDFEAAKKENSEVVRKYVTEGLQSIEEFKNECLNYEKLVKKELTKKEVEKLSPKELEEYQDKLYRDSLYRYDKKAYKEDKEFYESITEENYGEKVSLDGIWITFEKFINEFKIDCLSPFEHEDKQHGITILGKYFHS